MLSAGDHRLTPASQLPSVLMLVGLQGSGKTTTAAKLALQMKRQQHSPMLIAADLRRPAAIAQLQSLGKQLDIPVYSEEPGSATPASVAAAGVKRATELALTWAIVDTGGRLHIDDELMTELEEVKRAVSPFQTILVVDAMTGQDAVNAAEEFHQRVGLDGLILSKMDGDARGGAALSVTRVTGVPIKFIGTGERSDALEQFHPDRMASRILAMGDVMTLIERAQEAVDEEKARELERKMRTASFTLDDFLDQIQGVKKDGWSGIGDGNDARIGSPVKEDAGPVGRVGAEENRGHHPLDDDGRAGKAGDHQGQSAAGASRWAAAPTRRT